MIEFLYSLWYSIKSWIWPPEIDTPLSPLSPREPIHELDIDLRKSLTKVIYYYNPEKTKLL